MSHAVVPRVFCDHETLRLAVRLVDQDLTAEPRAQELRRDHVHPPTLQKARQFTRSIEMCGLMAFSMIPSAEGRLTAWGSRPRHHMPLTIASSRSRRSLPTPLPLPTKLSDMNPER